MTKPRNNATTRRGSSGASITPELSATLVVLHYVIRTSLQSKYNPRLGHDANNRFMIVLEWLRQKMISCEQQPL